MGILLLLLIIGLFFPFLWLPILVFAGLFLIFIPLKFTVDSLFNIFTVPTQIYKIATNPLLKKNHALEHAAVNILEQNSAYNNLAGYATEDGFYIMGAESPLEVERAARQGLKLMKQGQKELAVHKNCGTSLIVANFVSAIIFLGILFYLGYFSILGMLAAIILAHLFGPYLGQMVQKNFTTTPEVKEMEIDNASFESTGNWRSARKIFVKTSRVPYIR